MLTLAQAAATTPPTPAATAAPADAASQSTTLWQYIQDGGLLGYILIALSVVAVAYMIRNALLLRATRQVPDELVNKLGPLLARGALEEAARACRDGEQSESYLARTVDAAVERVAQSPYGTMELRTAIEDAGSVETERLHRNNDVLATIAAIGPMLGLLGTVIGMIGAFRTIGTMTGAQRSTQLATFMSMALVNTAQGLVVAIPCTIAYALFRRKIDTIVDDASRVLERLVSAGQRAGARAPAGVARAPVPGATLPASSAPVAPTGPRA